MNSSGYWEGGIDRANDSPNDEPVNVQFIDDDDGNNSPESLQQLYYTKGLEELESLHLLDLLPLANWKLSSSKQGFGLAQLREDSPESYWQSDGSNGSNTLNTSNTTNLANPHSITIQFSKKVSLERISIFTNFQLDESYTPSKVKIMAGSSDGWDLQEVCTVNFDKPLGWSHIIFNGIRNDHVLKCFMVKIIILANHQDGKDSHIRAVRCFGKKLTQAENTTKPSQDILHDLSLGSNLSGFSLNNRQITGISDRFDETLKGFDDTEVGKVSSNVEDVIGFNKGFQSGNLRTFSNIR